jgi:hypothetical protein
LKRADFYEIGPAAPQGDHALSDQDEEAAMRSWDKSTQHKPLIYLRVQTEKVFWEAFCMMIVGQRKAIPSKALRLILRLTVGVRNV